MNKVYQGDSRDILKILPHDVKIQTTITSPPYFDMKDYGVKGQIGYGQKYSDYLEDLKKVFSQIYKLTDVTGTLWIIIDTFKRNNSIITLPFDLVNKLNDVGWLLQDIIIWKKDKTVPWSSNGFTQRKFEYVLFFSKSIRFKANKDNARIYDTQLLKKWWIKYPERYNPKGKVMDEIWEFPIPVQGSWGSEYIRHFCPLPKEMVATMISISTDEKDIVFDPFAGTGTVLSEAAFMERKYMGIEINNDYIKMFHQYLDSSYISNHLAYKKLSNNDSQNCFENLILDLRALKFGRLLLKYLEDNTNNHIKIYVERKGFSNNSKSEVDYIIIGEYDANISEKINDIINRPPLSKFGIIPNFKFQREIDIEGKQVYFYSKTNSNSFLKSSDYKNTKVKIISPIKVDINEKDFE